MVCYQENPIWLLIHFVNVFFEMKILQVYVFPLIGEIYKVSVMIETKIQLA